MYEKTFSKMFVVLAVISIALMGLPMTVFASDEDQEYQALPFIDILPLPKGPVEINGETREIKIGFSQTGFNHPWRVAMIKSAELEIARHPNVSMIVTDGQVDVMKQTADVRDLLSQGVDAIVLSPIESSALVNAANEVMAAGIPLIVLDRDVFTDKTLFMGQDNYKIAYQLGELCGEKLNGKGDIVELQGILGTSVAIDRHQGFVDALQKHPEIKTIATGDAEFIREPAMALMEDWLVRFPKIDAVYSHAEESGWGAVQAIRQAGRAKENILQFTIDASNEGFRSVKKGEFTADGNYTPFIGDVGIRAAIYALQGQEIPNREKYEYGYEYELPELPVVTIENVDEWMGRGWGE